MGLVIGMLLGLLGRRSSILAVPALVFGVGVPLAAAGRDFRDLRSASGQVVGHWGHAMACGSMILMKYVSHTDRCAEVPAQVPSLRIESPAISVVQFALDRGSVETHNRRIR